MLQIKVGADIKEAVSALRQFSTEVDTAGSVTQSTAAKISTSLNKALGTIQSLSQQGISPIEVPVEVEKIDIPKTNISPIEIPVQANLSTLKDSLNNLKAATINLDTTKAQSDIKFLGETIETLEARVGAKKEFIRVVDPNDTAKLKGLNKEIQDLEKEIGRLKNVGKSGFDEFGNKIDVFGNHLNTLSKRTGATTQATINLGRVLQDAPFGFIGIANNLNPLLESFQRLQKETGSIGGTMKALAGSILGAGGIGLALSAFQFLALGGGDAIAKLAGGVKEFFGAAKPLVNIKGLFADVFKDVGKGAGEQLAKLELLKTKLNDLNIPASERVKVAKEYNEIADKQNQIDTKQIGNLDLINSKISKQNELILQRAIATSATSQLGTFADAFVEENLKVRQALSESPIFKDPSVQNEKDINKQFDAAEKLFSQKAKEFLSKRDALLNRVQNQRSVGGVSIGEKTRFGIEQEQDKLDAEIKRTLGSQGLILLDAIDARNKAAQKLQAANNALSSLISVEGLIPKPTGGDKKDKDKFGFLFDFLPFDPSGKLKPEQQGQLLDAIDKFSKEFNGILKGVNFSSLAKTNDEKIKLALKFDADLKAGNVKFDFTALQNEVNKIKPEELLPQGIDFSKALQNLEEGQRLAIDQFIRGTQNESERVRGLNLFGNIDIDKNLSVAVDQLKTQLQRLGRELPEQIDAVDIFGNPVTVQFSDLFDTSKIANNDALTALQNFFNKFKGQVSDFKTQISQLLKSVATESFSAFGEAIGNAVSGSGLSNAFQSLFQFIGGAIADLGKQMIVLSPIIAGLKLAIKTLNPALLLPAGIGLVAIGTALRNIKPKGFAKGGWVGGSGNGDTVPAMLTPGEFVLTKQDAARFVPLLKYLKAGLSSKLSSVRNSLPLHFASGGFVPNVRNTDISSPLGDLQKVLSGTALRTTTGGQLTARISGRDLLFVLDQTGFSNKRNFGR